MDSKLSYSRPSAAAERLGDLASDRHRFIGKRVLLTGEETTLAGENGRRCLLDSLRLLIRLCQDVSVWFPSTDGTLMREAVTLARMIEFGAPVKFPSAPPNYDAYDAVLSVGSVARADLPWTVINSNGWLARVSSGGTSLPSVTDQSNPIGSLAAACLGAADVFKRLIRVKESRGRLFDGLQFSLHTYRCGKDDLGPALPRDLPLDLLQVGLGAIGNGVVRLLSALPANGRVLIVDRQAFQDENLGTCILIGPSDIGKEKVSLGEMHLSHHLSVKGFPEEFDAFRLRLGKEFPYPKVILNCVDSIDARHKVQSLWPDVVIDGAIGDFGCQVSRHPWGPDIACLQCLFRHPPGESAEKTASRATGLSETRAQQLQDAVTEDDVRIAPTEKQVWLHEHLGHQVCSVVREAMARQISAVRQQEGFEPSVPFVACLSACMMVSELVKTVSGWPTTLGPRYQFDALQGPFRGQEYPQRRREDCICTTRARNIEIIRRRRAGNNRYFGFDLS